VNEIYYAEETILTGQFSVLKRLYSWLIVGKKNKFGNSVRNQLLLQLPVAGSRLIFFMLAAK
jgi:hypothetical protein